MDCVEVLYNAVSKELAITREEYEKTLVGWSISPITIDGNDIGVLMLRDKEIHMYIEPKKALIHMRRIIRCYFEPFIKAYGYLTTISFNDNDQIKFLERLGFYKTSEINGMISFRIDNAKIH